MSVRVSQYIPVMLTTLALACGEDTVAAQCGSDPVAAECATLCQEICRDLTGCGLGSGQCDERCGEAYACPGETIGQDRAICQQAQSEIAELSCDALCSWTANGAADGAPWAACGAEWQGSCSGLSTQIDAACPTGFAECFVAGGPCGDDFDCVPGPSADVKCGSTGYRCEAGKVAPFHVSGCAL